MQRKHALLLVLALTAIVKDLLHNSIV